jgi:hypothetical protein
MDAFNLLARAVYDGNPGTKGLRVKAPTAHSLGDHLKAAIRYHFKTGHREAA